MKAYTKNSIIMVPNNTILKIKNLPDSLSYNVAPYLVIKPFTEK